MPWASILCGNPVNNNERICLKGDLWLSWMMPLPNPPLKSRISISVPNNSFWPRVNLKNVSIVIPISTMLVWPRFPWNCPSKFNLRLLEGKGIHWKIAFVLPTSSSRCCRWPAQTIGNQIAWIAREFLINQNSKGCQEANSFQHITHLFKHTTCVSVKHFIRGPI